MDWPLVKERLHTAQQALEQALSPTAAEVQRVYRERATELSRRRAQTEPQGTLGFLVCRVGGELYALQLAQLAEVLVLSVWVRVPGASGEILGAINVRGDIRLLADLGLLLELPPGPLPSHNAGRCVVMLRRPELGLAVDSVERLVRLSPSAMIPVGDSGNRYVQFITQDGLRVLSADAFLTHSILGGKR